jgi:hypothetical protein
MCKAMRITKLPIPLLIAAAALTSVAVIYVYLTAPPMPIHTDPNFTMPLYPGSIYLWRGAAFEYIFSADQSVSIAYGTPYYLTYLTGPLHNITLADNMYIIHFSITGKTLYVIKERLLLRDGSSWDVCLVYKLIDVTPENVTIPNLSIYLPIGFNRTETLSNEEDSVLYNNYYCASRGRVLSVEVNGTHLIYRTSTYTTYPHGEGLFYKRLTSPVTGKTIKVTNKPISRSYTVGGTAYTAMLLPYLHFAIDPQDTTTLVVYVS